MAKADFLKEKAEAFLENGKEKLNQEVYFLAAFNFEQAAQLYLKYCFFLKLKDFPKIHEIDQLLQQLAKVYKKKEVVNKFLKKHASVIGDLNQAYITSRYLPVEFNKYQVEKMEEFVENLISFLKKYVPKFNLN